MGRLGLGGKTMVWGGVRRVVRVMVDVWGAPEVCMRGAGWEQC